ncbi:MAG: type II toxin-antitoxin system VapC family toxin [Thaumarchaeota archaeon]|nr:MAG: type II toxin-antitoxin system VapC family toxin [Nitrososphaerota archaeon]
MLVYLDSSAIVKRYIEEKGSESVDSVYEVLEKEGAQRVAFSIWNMGEVFGAIDARRQRGEIDEKDMSEAIRLFVGETRKFVAMRRLTVLPIGGKVLQESRNLILKHHMYQADALQLATAREAEAALILTADRKLAECAKSEEIQVKDPERDYDTIVSILGKKP